MTKELRKQDYAGSIREKVTWIKLKYPEVTSYNKRVALFYKEFWGMTADKRFLEADNIETVCRAFRSW